MILKIKCSHPTIILNPYFEKLYRASKAIVAGNHTYILRQDMYYLPYDTWSPKRQQVTLSNYEDYYFVSDDGECTPLYILVPCGKCLLCRDKKASEWCFRAICESRYSSSTPLFVTLTYNEENLPDDGVDKRAVQLFLKRLRFHLSEQFEDLNLRYFACGEYGSKFGRPHYHLILWNFPEVHMVRIRYFVEYAWQRQGFITVYPVKKGGINYVMKYMRKDCPNKLGYKNEPFYLSSRRGGGLGIKYCNDITDWCRRNSDVKTLTVQDPFTGVTMTFGIPRYFKEKIFPTESKLVPKEVRDAYSNCNYFYARLKSECPSIESLLDSDYYKEFKVTMEDFATLRSKYCFLPTVQRREYLDLSVPDEFKHITDRARYFLSRMQASMSVIINYDCETWFIMDLLSITQKHRDYMNSLPQQLYNVEYLEEKLKNKMKLDKEKETF